jgi:hypothetical protein
MFSVPGYRASTGWKMSVVDKYPPKTGNGGVIMATPEPLKAPGNRARDGGEVPYGVHLFAFDGSGIAVSRKGESAFHRDADEAAGAR